VSWWRLAAKNAVIGPIVPSPSEDVFEDEYRPDYAVSPGDLLEYELELHRVSKSPNPS